MADIIFRSNRLAVEKALAKAIDTGMEAVAKAGAANAKREITKLVYDKPPSPRYVRTGDLRNSLTGKYIPAERTAYIGTNMEYAQYVEFGTIYMPARPYLRNACQNYAQEYRMILQDAMSR